MKTCVAQIQDLQLSEIMKTTQMCSHMHLNSKPVRKMTTGNRGNTRQPASCGDALDGLPDKCTAISLNCAQQQSAQYDDAFLSFSPLSLMMWQTPYTTCTTITMPFTPSPPTHTSRNAAHPAKNNQHHLTAQHLSSNTLTSTKFCPAKQTIPSTTAQASDLV